MKMILQAMLNKSVSGQTYNILSSRFEFDSVLAGGSTASEFKIKASEAENGMRRVRIFLLSHIGDFEAKKKKIKHSFGHIKII